MIYFLLLLAIFPFLVPVGAKRIVATVATALISVVVMAVSFSVLTQIKLPVEWFASVALTPIGAIFAIMFSVTFLSVMLVDRTDRSRPSNLLSLFYSSAVALYISLVAVLVAPTLWDFALSWELVGCSSFVVMLCGADRREYLHSAIIYFIAMHVGFIFIVAGFLSIDTSRYLWGAGGIGIMAWLMFFVGFGLKSAIFPLHFWLPSAYRTSTGTGAALLSGGATNIGLYGILSICYASNNVQTVGFILFCFGTVAALFGAFKMIRARFITDVLSYSSIENLGVITLAIGLSFYAKAQGFNSVSMIAMVGAMLRMFTHATSKALLFATVGQVKRSTATDEISLLGGLARRMPFATSGFAVGGLTLTSMPPFGGFLSEFLIFAALFVAVGSQTLAIMAIIGIIALALASASTIFNISKSFGVGFLGLARSEVAQRAKEHRPVGVLIGYALFFALATVGSWALCVLMLDGVDHIFMLTAQSEWVWGVLKGVVLSCSALVGVVGLLWILRRMLTKNRQNAMAPTWSCAYDSKEAPLAQYTAESFASEAALVVEYKNSVHSKTKAALSARISPMRFMRRWTARLALLQTGRPSHYVMHIILFLALVLLLTITSAI